MKLYPKFTASILFCALVPLSLALGLFVSYTLRNSEDQAVSLAVAQMKTCSEQLSSFFTARASEVETLSSVPLIRRMNFSRAEPYLHQELARHSGVYEKFIIGNLKGNFYNTSGGNPFRGKLRTFNDSMPGARLRSIKGRDYWQYTVARNIYHERNSFISDPMISYTTDERQVVVAASILSSSGKVAGMIGGTISWETISAKIDIIKEEITEEFGWDAQFFLISSRGIYWYHWDPARAVHLLESRDGSYVFNRNGEKIAVRHSILDESDPLLARIGQEMINGGEGTERIMFPGSESKQVLAYAPVKGVRYSLAMVVPEDQIMAPQKRIRNIFLFILLFAVILAFGAANFFSRIISKPIIALNDSARNIADGKWHQNIPVRSSDEIGGLTKSFNMMHDAVKKNIDDLNHEISERKKAQDSLRKARSFISNIINSMPSVLVSVDSEGRVTQWNRTAEHATGISEEAARGNKLSDLVKQSEPWTGLIKESINSGAVKVETRRPRQSEKGTVYEDITIYPLVANGSEGAVIRIDDVTRHYTMEQQFSQSRKMDAVGQLAGGIAHDFNNMLAGIMSAAELLKSRGGVSEEGKRFIRLIIDTVQRASDLTTKLLTFSRKAKTELIPVNLHTVIRDSSAILERSLDKKIRITADCRAERPEVEADQTGLQSVFMNMGINAGHAMPEGGELAFSTRNVQLDESWCRSIPFDVEPGLFIEVEVRDTGCGISSEYLEKIFDPFFTTRKTGQGTGLGLSVAYGTIRDHHGAVTVQSDEGLGTVFHIYLPVSSGTVSDSGEDEKSVYGDGRILLVDDEPVLRDTTRALLEDLNYTVLTAVNGKEAVEIYGKEKNNIDLVILDMIMPEMNGAEAFHLLREIDSGVRVIIASGFSGEGSPDKLNLPGICGFIGKPFRKSELSRIVAEVMKKENRA